MRRLEGRRALVTGGSRGIGKGIALALAEDGADVVIGFRRAQEQAEAVVGELQQLGRRSAAFAADVRNAEAVQALVADARETLGGLDIVVANAGVATRFESLHEVDPGYFARVVEIDLYGVFHTLHAAIPVLRAQGAGVVLSVSSIAADACEAKGGPYVAAKAAVNALTRVAARENAAHGVRCNAIAPGLIETDMAEGMRQVHGAALERSVPLGRIGTPQEVGRLAAYLASDDAAWITGKVFRIDGGQV